MPANYSEEQAKDFAASLAAAGQQGPQALLASMKSAFWPGGSEELQRNPRWGIPPDSFVRPYTSGASDHFGYVTGKAGLPRELAEVGGGMHNLFSKLRNPSIDASGKLGLSKVNEANIAQGYAAGSSANKPPAAFDDYGTRPEPTTGQIGEGGGISPFAAALAGVNPDEPTPPDWPPQQNDPVRYLGRLAK